MVKEGNARPGNFKDVDDAIDFAIGQEEKAAAFYRRFAKRAVTAGVRKKCEDMALEEDRHKEMLVSLKAGLPSGIATGRVVDLKLSDYLRSFDLPENADQQDLLIAAMKSEARAEKLYLDLAGVCTLPQVKEVLLRLAAEEGKHKHELEKDYDDRILGSN